MFAKRTKIRTCLVAVLASAVSLVLAACGGGGDQGGTQPPAAPSNVVATPGPGYVTVTWQHDGQRATGFDVYRTSGGSLRAQVTTEAAGDPIGTAPAVARSFKDDAITPGVTYTYSVEAKGSGGSSTASSASGGTTLEPGIDIMIGSYTNTLISQTGTAIGIYWYLSEAQVDAGVGTLHLRGPAGWNGGDVLDIQPPSNLSAAPDDLHLLV